MRIMTFLPIFIGFNLYASEVPPQTPCLAATTAQQTTAMACGSQGFVSFIDLNNSDLKQPENLVLTLRSKSDSQGVTLKNPVVTNGQNGTNLYFKSSGLRIRFENAKLLNSPPDFGFVVIDGNSGSCKPVRSGTPLTCHEVIASQKYGPRGNFIIPEIVPPKTKVDFLYSSVRLEPPNHSEDHRTTESTHLKAEEFCSAIGARLPTLKELAEEIQRLSLLESVRNTAFTDVPVPYDGEIADPSFRKEFEDMKKDGFKSMFYLNEKAAWVVDFYLKPRYESGFSSIAAEIHKAHRLNKYDYVKISSVFLAPKNREARWQECVFKFPHEVQDGFESCKASVRSTPLCVKSK